MLYVGDHGIAFPRAKCTLYDPGIEISLIARLPGSALSGGVAPGGMVSNLDVVPTLIELTGAEAPPNLHGVSLLPVADGSAPGYTELFVEKTYHSYYDPMRGLHARSVGSTSATSRPAWGWKFPATSPVAAPTATWPAAWTPRTTWPWSFMTCTSDPNELKQTWPAARKQPPSKPNSAQR